MLDTWIEIFRTGTHTDAGGTTRQWSESDLDAIASSYDPATHEAPVVIGHPRDNAPAWGWVSAVKRSGDRLLATFRDVSTEFAAMVKAGRYKKRSIALYPDMTLRHVGFLGAMPPAVKGLENIAFADGDAITIEYGEESSAGQSPGGNTMADDTQKLEEMTAQLASMQEELAAAKQQAAEFAEAEKKTAARLAAIKAEAEKAASLAFAEGLVKDGRLPVGMKDDALALLDAAAPGYAFGEGESMGAAIRDFLGKLPQMDFSEIATHGNRADHADMEFAEDMKIARMIAGVKEEQK